LLYLLFMQEVEVQRGELVRALEAGDAAAVVAWLDANAEGTCVLLTPEPKDGQGVLFAAAVKGHEEMVKLLLSRGMQASAKVWTKISQEVLPLVVCRRGRGTMVQLLIDCGVNPAIGRRAIEPTIIKPPPKKNSRRPKHVNFLDELKERMGSAYLQNLIAEANAECRTVLQVSCSL
jgi:hypothetical protein